MRPGCKVDQEKSKSSLLFAHLRAPVHVCVSLKMDVAHG